MTPVPIKLVDLMTAYQGSALIGTAVESGLADLLAEGPLTIDEIIAKLGTDDRGTMALLAGLASYELVERDEDRFSLTGLGAPLAGSHPETVAQIVLKEWFFYKLWAEMPVAVKDGHARTGPWRERLENDPSQAHAFLRALDDLCTLFGGELPELAGLDAAGRLLDAGGGAGSHAANLVEANPEIEATVLDLPGAEPVLRERHPELGFVEGKLGLRAALEHPPRPPGRSLCPLRERSGLAARAGRQPGDLRLGDRPRSHQPSGRGQVHPDDGGRERRRLDLVRRGDRRLAHRCRTRPPADEARLRTDRSDPRPQDLSVSGENQGSTRQYPPPHGRGKPSDTSIFRMKGVQGGMPMSGAGET
jgi:hypothetical protein